MDSNYKYSEITEGIIRAFYKVYNKLGFGFLEKVYENALAIEIAKSGLGVDKQVAIKVWYDEQEVGFYFADMIVGGKVIVELKAAESLAVQHEAQLTNYLKATEYEVGVLLNFGKKAELKRKVFDNNYK